MTFPAHIINGSLCYLIHNEQVLLLRRKRPPHAGLWTPPGGKSEHGESPQETVIREMAEETGLIIEQPVLRALQTTVDVHYPVHWMLVIFVATQFSGSLIDSDEGILQWHAIQTLEQLDRPYTDTLYHDYIFQQKPGIWQGKEVYDTPGRLLQEIVY